MTVRNKQYHEVSIIDRKAARLALRSTSRLQAKIFDQYIQLKHHNHLIQIDITDDLIRDLIRQAVAAAIVSHLRGAKRSFLFAEADSNSIPSFNLQETLSLNYNDELLLAYEDTHRKFKKPLHPERKKKSNVVKRVSRLPIKKSLKRGLKSAVNITVEGFEEEAPEHIVERVAKVKKLYKVGYKGGKKVYQEIKREPIRNVGQKVRIKSVPSPYPKRRLFQSKGRFKQRVREETERVKKEFHEKLKQEKKYVYDEIIRHLRTIIKDVVKTGIKVTNWQEVFARLSNQQRSVADIESLIKHDRYEVNKSGKQVLVEKGIETYKERLIEKLINKAKRKIRDKKDRLKAEAALKGLKEAHRAVTKPILQKVKEKVEYKVFGEPRKAGSHRQYRGMHYYVAKSLQELEPGQKRRRLYEKGQRVYGALGSIADLVAFFSEYSVQDTFAFMAEVGGKVFFPETYKIGGVVKAANWINTVANTLDFTDEDEFTKVKKYQIDRALNLIQELTTLKKLFSIYHPQVYKILENASGKVNNNLRITINNLILSGATLPEAKKVLAEAFKANGIAPSNPYQIETIYRTQAQLAYSAGRFQTDQHPAIQEILWGYLYKTVGDSRVRPAHRILDGVTLPKDHEFWLYFWPPNSWNCRCSVISLFEERKIVLPPTGWEDLLFEDAKDFSFNPGLVFTEAYAKLK